MSVHRAIEDLIRESQQRRQMSSRDLVYSALAYFTAHLSSLDETLCVGGCEPPEPIQDVLNRFLEEHLGIRPEDENVNFIEDWDEQLTSATDGPEPR